MTETTTRGTTTSGEHGRKRALLIGVVAVLGVALAVWALAALTSPANDRASTAQFSFLAESPDPVPSGLDLGALGVGGVAADSVRLLGTYEGHEIYFGTDSAENSCLIVYAEASEASASSCGPSDGLGEAPLGVAVWSATSGGIEAYLVPDNSVVEQMPDGWELVTPNVLAIEVATETADQLVVEMPNGESVILHRQP